MNRRETFPPQAHPIDLRQNCRQCRGRLPAPTDNPRWAFCSRGCHSRFYSRHCRVCEGVLPGRSTRRRRLCGRPSCRAEFRRQKELFDPPKGVIPDTVPNASKIPAKSTAFWPLKTGRPWRQIAGPTLTAAELHLATLGAEPDKPKAVPIFQRTTPPANLIGGYKFPDAPNLATLFGRKGG